MSGLKDAARLLGYFIATIVVGALLAPPLYWLAQRLSAHGTFPSLAQFGFEAFFHRAVMLAAILLSWPLLRWLRIARPADLGLKANPSWFRDASAGFVLSALPLFCLGGGLLVCNIYIMRETISWTGLGSVLLAALFVPFLEEALFRGLFLGVLLRKNPRNAAIVISAAIFSIVHFVKAPERTNSMVRWNSGFHSVTHAFGQFTDPILLLAGFTTLFLIGWILAYARVRTESLWLPIGLHAGWIFSSGAFNKIAARQTLALPWLGKNLLIGLAPLCVGFATWALVKYWLSYVGKRER